MEHDGKCAIKLPPALRSHQPAPPPCMSGGSPPSPRLRPSLLSRPSPPCPRLLLQTSTPVPTTLTSHRSRSSFAPTFSASSPLDPPVSLTSLTPLPLPL